MIVEHPEVAAGVVAATVVTAWGVDVTHAEHLPVGRRRWHWALGDDTGPQWFATVEPVPHGSERTTLLASYDGAARLAQRLGFVVAPVPTRDGRVAVDLAPGLLLTVTPFLDGPTVGHGPFTCDRDRAVVANMMGDLHRQRRLRHLPVWRPRIGRRGHDRREELLARLGDHGWAGGPWSGPASRLVRDAEPLLLRSLRRFSLLGAATAGTAQRWVVSHGGPGTSDLVRTPDGHRLVGWGSLALAPRERDLRLSLGSAEGDEPWFGYLEGGGVPEPLAPDVVEMFALQHHLTEVTEHVVRLDGPHGDGPDEHRWFAALETELAALLARWG
ncbi:MAG: hypothetical protein WB441_09320 [Nocardioidaceae bacterium]